MRDPFASWGGYVESSGDPHRRYYTDGQHPQRLPASTTSCRRSSRIGIPFLGNLQDRAMTETMGPIYDRTQEHLGTTDAMVIFVRRRLIEAARALRDQGALPANVDDPSLCRVRPASAVLPDGDELDQRDGEGAPVRRRRADRVGAVRLMARPSPRPSRAPRLLRGGAVPARARVGRARRPSGSVGPSTRSCPAASPRRPRRSRRSTSSTSSGAGSCGSCGTAAPRSPFHGHPCGTSTRQKASRGRLEELVS